MTGKNQIVNHIFVHVIHCVNSVCYNMMYLPSLLMIVDVDINLKQTFGISEYQILFSRLMVCH